MKDFEKKKLKYELIEIYEGYLMNHSDKRIIEKAQKLFFDYVYSVEIIDKNLISAIQGLEHIGWEYPRLTRIVAEGLWRINDEEVRKILDKLRKTEFS